MIYTVVNLTLFIVLFSLYSTFPALTPRNNTKEFFNAQFYGTIVKHGLGRSASQQAGYQIAALVLSMAIAVVGGFVTGRCV